MYKFNVHQFWDSPQHSGRYLSESLFTKKNVLLLLLLCYIDFQLKAFTKNVDTGKIWELTEVNLKTHIFQFKKSTARVILLIHTVNLINRQIR